MGFQRLYIQVKETGVCVHDFSFLGTFDPSVIRAQGLRPSVLCPSGLPRPPGVRHNCLEYIINENLNDIAQASYAWGENLTKKHGLTNNTINCQIAFFCQFFPHVYEAQVCVMT